MPLLGDAFSVVTMAAGAGGGGLQSLETKVHIAKGLRDGCAVVAHGCGKESPREN